MLNVLARVTAAAARNRVSALPVTSRLFITSSKVFQSSSEPVDPQPPTGSSATPTIPPFIENFEEPVADKRARLIYQSRKRGIRENGLLLATFADKYLSTFNEEELALYDRLINLPSNDWEIYYWATGVRPTPSEFDNKVMSLLKEHTKNKNKESRFHLPALK